MSEFSDIPNLEPEDRRLVLARELAYAVHELQPVPQDEPIEVQHAMMLMATVHCAMAGMDFHLSGIHRTTFATFVGVLMDYISDNAVIHFTEDAADVMELGINVLVENLQRLQESGELCPPADEGEE